VWASSLIGYIRGHDTLGVGLKSHSIFVVMTLGVRLKSHRVYSCGHDTVGVGLKSHSIFVVMTLGVGLKSHCHCSHIVIYLLIAFSCLSSWVDLFLDYISIMDIGGSQSLTKVKTLME
jgi:hypothetical protein